VNRHRVWVFGLAALLAALVVVAFRLYVADSKTTGEQLGRPAIGGAFALTDQDGRAVTDATYSGKMLLVFFGYTYCPDVCPTELQGITLVLDELKDAAGAKVQGLFVTIDPARDTPQALKEYLSNFHPAIRGLTGTPEQVAAAARTYKAYYAKAKDNGDGSYLMDHSAFVYLMDGEGRYLAHFRPGATTDDIVAAIRKRL
jgi:protein SCO1/2